MSELDKKIGQLAAGGALAGTEKVAGLDGATNKYWLTSQFGDLSVSYNPTVALNSVRYFDAAGAPALMTVTAAARSVLDDADVATMRATLQALGNSGAQQMDGSARLTVNSTASAFVAAGTEVLCGYGTGTVIAAVHADGGQGNLRAYSYGSSVSSIRSYAAAGTYAAKTDLASGADVSFWSTYGYVAGAFTELSSIRTKLTSATPGASNKQTTLTFLACRDGSSGIVSLMRLQYGINESYQLFAPATDNNLTLGTSSQRWSVIYAGTGTINTSDARTKRDVAAIPDELLDAWGAVEWVQYRFLDALEEKGDAARWHMGLIAQAVRDAIDDRLGAGAALRLGLVCHDAWDAREEIVEPVMAEREVRRGRRRKLVIEQYDTGEVEVVQHARTAGDRWGLRYEECFAVEAAWQRREIARNADRLATLEARFAA